MAGTHSFREPRGAAAGRTAERPSAIPARGYKDVLGRTKRNIKRDVVPLLAAGVAFYALLALVPALVALVSIYGLVADPADIERDVEDVLAAAPTEVQDLVNSQLSSIVESSPSSLQVGALAGVAVALWSASSGVKHLMTAVNRAYHETETRGFLRLRATALLLTIVLLILGGVILVVVAAPNALSDSGAEGVARTVLLVARWPLAALVVIFALSVLYRHAPDREDISWRWVSPGALLATLVWLVASAAFSIYTANFGSYNETYGALGAVIVVMLWLFLGSYAVIAGAEVNAALEAEAEEIS